MKCPITMKPNHEVKPMPVAYEKVSAVMDEETYKWHHDTHYAGYVGKRNEIEGSPEDRSTSPRRTRLSAYSEP